ncbi:hypothetical protein Tco_0825598 [Tanacetum coccineum]
MNDALWAFRTAYITPTGTTPYKLIYGKNYHLPFEIEHRAYWALKNCNPDLITAGEKRMFQLHELDELRHQAYENSHLYKERTKVWHVAKVTNKKRIQKQETKSAISLNNINLNNLKLNLDGSSQELKTVSYHKLYDILKQHQNEVNEIRTERLARTANPLTLVALQQPKPATVTEDEEMSKEKEIDKLMALISLSFKKIYKPTNNNLRTSSNTNRANQYNSPRIKRGTVMYQGNVQKPKRVKDAAYHEEKMLLCKQEEAGFQLNAEQADWKDDTDDESDDQELESHYMYKLAKTNFKVTHSPVDNSLPS